MTYTFELFRSRASHVLVSGFLCLTVVFFVLGGRGLWLSLAAIAGLGVHLWAYWRWALRHAPWGRGRDLPDIAVVSWALPLAVGWTLGPGPWPPVWVAAWFSVLTGIFRLGHRRWERRRRHSSPNRKSDVPPGKVRP